MFRSALVVGSTPLADAFKAEDMVTFVKHAELATLGHNLVETNLTLGVIAVFATTL